MLTCNNCMYGVKEGHSYDCRYVGPLPCVVLLPETPQGRLADSLACGCLDDTPAEKR